MLTLGVVAMWPASASSVGSVTPFGTVHAPIFADLNGDGLRDKATLGQVGTSNICTVTVQDGLPGGGFGPPKVHKYTSVENTFPLCPDVGTAIKLGNHNRPDIVTGFNFGFTDIVALHQFKPSAVFTGVEQPNLMVTADFNGDGRDDLLEYTNQGTGLVTFTNTPAGTLVRGSISVCVEVGLGPQYDLADFNGDGGQDILLSQICARQRPSVAAVVLFGNGQAQETLASTCDLTVSYTVFVIDLDRDGVPDVGVITTKANTPTTIRYFRNDGTGHFTEVNGSGAPATGC